MLPLVRHGVDDVRDFIDALHRKDDESAVSLLQSGRVTICSPVPSHLCTSMLGQRKVSCGASASWTMMRCAISCEREEVALALVRLGANLDELYCRSDIDSVSPECTATSAGFAILEGKVSVLSLCHRLGASMSSVMPSGGRPTTVSESVSALGLSILAVQPACLKYLLDFVFPTRPIFITRDEAFLFCMVAVHGKRAMALYQVLETRGMDFKFLDETPMSFEAETPEEAEALEAVRGGGAAGGSDGCTLTDIIVSNALESGDDKLMFYLLKKLRLVSTMGKLDMAKRYVEIICSSPASSSTQGGPPRAPCENGIAALPEAFIRKFACVECEVVSHLAHSCIRCKAQYCSKECQKKLWKSGGHEQECREVQRRSAEISSVSAGSAVAN